MKTNQQSELNEDMIEKSTSKDEVDAVIETSDTGEAMVENTSTESGENTAQDMASEYLRDLQRCQADFANYKKRQQESQKELAGYLIEKLVMEITPVLDNFQMATSHVPAEAANSPWVTGIQYIEKQLEKVLTDNGMEVIAVKEGDVFDPSVHEAISEQKTEDAAAIDMSTKAADTPTEAVKVNEQVIAQVLQKGYKIGNKVIRPAKVSVR
jgi:molecular chaperone GrpE